MTLQEKGLEILNKIHHIRHVREEEEKELKELEFEARLMVQNIDPLLVQGLYSENLPEGRFICKVRMEDGAEITLEPRIRAV